MKCKLNDIVSSANTGADAIKKAPIVNEKTDLRCLRIGDVSQKREFNEWGYTITTDTDYEKFKLNKGDSIIARTGNTIGVCCFIEDDIKAVYNNGLIRLTANMKLVRDRYLFYVISSKKCQKFIQSIAFGTSTQPNMKIKDFLNFEIDLPQLDVQDKIIEIISKIDNKIMNNNKINNNLDEQMQALYKSWFVDYEPFNGTKPANWKLTDIYSVANIIYGAPFASKMFNTEGLGKPIIRIRDLKEQEFVTFTTEIHPKGHLIHPGDIVVGMDGEFRPYIWGNEEAWLNQRVCIFENKQPKRKAFVLYTIKPLLNHIEQTQVATTVIHIGKKDYDSFEILLPDESTLNKFDEITAPMIEQIVNNRLENKRLAKLRDTLLPRLMSGEIDVSGIEL